MKAWTTATAPGRCSFDRGHTWAAGERIVRVQGVGWLKDYCATCGKTRHGAGEDTGEVLELADAPNYPKPLYEFANTTRDLFDAKMAAAGMDDE